MSDLAENNRPIFDLGQVCEAPSGPRAFCKDNHPHHFIPTLGRIMICLINVKVRSGKARYDVFIIVG